jgi:hypothetical protein
VADGHPNSQVSTWDADHVVLPRAHADYGNTPRAIGSLLAHGEGYDAIAYLDADNWLYPEHVAAMVALHDQSGAPVCTATRTIHRVDGSLMFVDTESDGIKHADTNCLFFTREMFRLLPLWSMMPRELAPHCDRLIWSAIIGRDVDRGHCSTPTVAYRTMHRVHYERVGETPPPGARHLPDLPNHPRQWWGALTKEQQDAWQTYFVTGKW